MIGFTRDAIHRFNDDVKVDKTWPLIYLKRWAASPDTFTMDFGSHEPDYVTFVTDEGEKISQLIAGYIDILLKRIRDMPYYDEDDERGELGMYAPLMKVLFGNVTIITVKGCSESRVDKFNQLLVRDHWKWSRQSRKCWCCSWQNGKSFVNTKSGHSCNCLCDSFLICLGKFSIDSCSEAPTCDGTTEER
jgi:ribosomal protein S17E